MLISTAIGRCACDPRHARPGPTSAPMRCCPPAARIEVRWWQRVLCRLGLHRRDRLATPDPTVWRELCAYCGDERVDVDEVD